MCTVNLQCRVHQCYECSEDTEYYCELCSYDLCTSCKENHAYDLNTVDHQIFTYLRKVNCYPIVETCVRHHNIPYQRYCQFCKFPVCCHCMGHRKHNMQDVRTAYEATLHHIRKIIHIIRSETLNNRCFCLNQVKDCIKEWHTNSPFAHPDMLTRAYKLNNQIDKAFKHFDYKHSCLRQIISMKKHLASLENFEQIYDWSATTPVQCLVSIKKTKCHRLYLKRHTNQMFLTELIRKKDVIDCMNKIKKTDIEKRYEDKFLKLMSFTKLHKSFSLSQDICCHISLVTSDLVWVSDHYDLFLSNTTTGNMLYHINDLNSESFFGYGFHTVNNEGNLFYINMNFNINKLSRDLKTKTVFIEKNGSTLKPICVYCSPLTGDLLVVNTGIHPFTITECNITRYNEMGQLIQIIQYNNRGQELFTEPCYITENNNGDVVVSDDGAIVVTDREGKHRFSYTGRPLETVFWPQGICTDALSHILVCDKNTNTVHMLNSDGQFLSYLLIRPSGIFSPVSLCYDAITHRILIGSSLNYKVCIYRYITRENGLFDENKHTVQKKQSLKDVHFKENEKPSQLANSRLLLMSDPELLQSFTMRGLEFCNHITCVTSNLAWISDENQLILTNNAGHTLNRWDFLKNRQGCHTINSNNELIYIDKKDNIVVLSNDMETTITFIESTDFLFIPTCIYWSPYTGDLLVGMLDCNTQTGKVIRYNQIGKETQIMHRDNTGEELYSRPRYITENNNGDIVVCDYGFDDNCGAVVVTEQEGIHRFSYTGHPSGSEFQPRGICTDVLSHILVCDDLTETIQILSKDGQFLSNLRTKKSVRYEISPYCLGYDVKTHLLWVGSKDESNVRVYRYLMPQKELTERNKGSGNLFSSYKQSEN